MSDAPSPPDETTPAPPASGDDAATPRGLHRSRSQHVVAGVAGGLGERFDIDANIVRVAFVVLAFMGGLGVLLYVAMWALLPVEGGAGARVVAPVVRVRSPRAIVVILVALAALTVAWSWHDHRFTAGPSIGWGPNVGHLFGLMWLVVLGIVVVTALRGRSRGAGLLRLFGVLLVVGFSALILTVAAGFAYLATTGVPLAGGSGSRSWQPSSLADVRHQYRTLFGSETLDLRGVRFPVRGFTVDASVAVGVLNIYVPAGAVVDLHTRVGAGSTSTYAGAVNGFYGTNHPFRPVPSSITSAAQAARAPHLTLDAQVGAGRLVVVRAPG